MSLSFFADQTTRMDVKILTMVKKQGDQLSDEVKVNSSLTEKESNKGMDGMAKRQVKHQCMDPD